jgi:hypothetical protein
MVLYLGSYSQDIDSFETIIGRKVNLFSYYWNINYLSLYETYISDFLPYTTDRRIMFSWDFCDPTTSGPTQPEYKLSTILDGSWDTEINAWFEALAALPYTVLFRPLYEMNGNWMAWSEGVNENTTGQFIQAWRYLHDKAIANNATNLKWVWCPNNTTNETAMLDTWTQYYPGDQYVDWIGIDGYNWGTYDSNIWQTFDQIFLDSYNALISKTSKPLIVCECSCQESGGSKPTWITTTFQNMGTKYPGISCLVWFEEHYSGDGWDLDWRVETTTDSLNAFKAAMPVAPIGAMPTNMRNNLVYTPNVWLEHSLSEIQKLDFLNSLETQYDRSIEPVLIHRHDARYYTKTLADDRFFGSGHQGIGSGMNAGKLDGYTADAIVSTSIPTGLIVMYAGTGYTLPTGWDTYNNMDGRFLVGAGGTYAVKNSGGSQYMTATDPLGTIMPHGLADTEMPSHTHAFNEWQNSIIASYRKNDSNQHLCYAYGSEFTHTDNAKNSAGIYAASSGHSHDNNITINQIDHTPPYVILQYMKKT